MNPAALFEKVWHPIAFSLFPVLLLYSYNAFLPFTEVLLTVVLVALGALLLTRLFSLVTRDQHKAGLMVTVFALFFFSFGHIGLSESVTFSAGPIIMGPNKIKFMLWLGGIIGAAYFIYRICLSLRNITLILNAVALTLVLTTLVSLVIEQVNLSQEETQEATPSTAGRTYEKPDIYYIIYDEYAGIRTLERDFGYDNSSFYDELRKRGFVVPELEFSNYSQTYLSLASSLNMMHLAEIAEHLDKDSADWSYVYGLVEDSRVVRELKGLGYSFFTFRSGYHPTNFNRHADLNFQKGVLNEFMTTFVYTTMLGPLANAVVEHDKRERTLYAFETLPVIAENPLPTFTFVHLIAPHQPYVFGPNGEQVGGVYDDLRVSEADRDEEGRWTDARKTLYIGEVTYLNKKTIEVVDAIRARSTHPPIIILQSDHGSKSNGNLNFPSEALHKERMEIFTAVLFPDRSEALAALNTPVNTFRILFNAYFEGEYELLPSASFYSTLDRPFDFTDVSEVLSR